MAQDVLEGNNVNTALAKHSKEAICGLVPQAGSGRKATKRKVQFCGLPQFKKRKTVCVGSRPRRLSTLVVNLSGAPWQNYKIGTQGVHVSAIWKQECVLAFTGIRV